MTMKLDLAKLDEAFGDPNTRRMTLSILRAREGESSRKLAKALGVSIFHYQEIEIGRRPLSEEAFLQGMQALGITPEYLAQALLAVHQFVLDLADSWPKVWRERLEPLDFETRRDLVLADKGLHNWGLGELLCEKSLEAVDPEEAVHLAELALLAIDASILPPKSKQHLIGYARGHQGHALLRRGDSKEAEAAFALAVEEWMTREGGPWPEDARQIGRLASIVPGFPKDEALQKLKRKRRKSKERPK
jgi:transcriptional regulator with XRE-family HTH domain